MLHLCERGVNHSHIISDCLVLAIPRIKGEIDGYLFKQHQMKPVKISACYPAERPRACWFEAFL